MTRRGLGWASLALTLSSCTDIVAAQPDAGTTPVLAFGTSVPTLGMLPSQELSGRCVLIIQGLQVITSTQPDAGASITGQAYLNYKSKDPPSVRNNMPLPNFDNLVFRPVGTSTSYALDPANLVIDLGTLTFWLFPRSDSRTNYLTVSVSDGQTTLLLVWGLDLSSSTTCDPRPF